MIQVGEILKEAASEEGVRNAAVEKLAGGYTKLPNAILMEIVSGNLSKAEIKILLLTARLTISFQRKMTSLSKTSIERYTSLQGKDILRAIESLEQKDLIKKIKGDQYTSNKLGLRESAPKGNPLPSGDDTDGNVGPLNNPPPDQKRPEGESLKSTSPTDEKGPHFKEYSRNNILETLSTLDESNPIRAYFEALKPATKRRSEIEKFNALRGEYSDSEISRSLAYLRKNGVPHSGAICHSPMAYLSVAITDILAATQNISKSVGEAPSTSVSNESAKIKKETREAQSHEEQVFYHDSTLFQKAFPTKESQQAYISTFSRNYPFFQTDGVALRNIAIQAWANRNHNQMTLN